MKKTKKILALILVVVFALTTLASPVLAWHPDDIRYNNGGAEPEGDEIGWGDPSGSPSSTLDNIFYARTSAPTLRFTSYTWVVSLLFYFGVFELQIEKPSGTGTGDDNTDSRDITESSEAARR